MTSFSTASTLPSDLSRRSALYWTMFMAITMSLGWGLRGYIGGGPLGAMIPGVLIALALCILLGRGAEAGLMAAFGAVGIGFGGQMTYGQTIYLSLQPETMWWGLGGLTLKGAIWGLLGGAVLGLAFVDVVYHRMQLLIAFLLMVAGTYTGWKLINEPKLIYFSNLADKPRPEIWAGLLLGSLALLGYMETFGISRMPARFAAFGFLGGGAGFGIGAWLQVLGRTYWPGTVIDYWKVMEFTFGLLLGAALGYCAWRHRGELSRVSSVIPELRLFPASVLFLVLAALSLMQWPDSRLQYSMIGAALLALSLWSTRAAWHIGVTLTCAAFLADLVRNTPYANQPMAWLVISLPVLAIASAVELFRSPIPLFILTVAVALLDSLTKSTFRPTGTAHLLVEGVFILMSIAVLVLQHRRQPRPIAVAAAFCLLFTVGVLPAQSPGPVFGAAPQAWTLKLGELAIGSPVHIGTAEDTQAVAVALRSGRILAMDANGKQLREMRMDLAPGSAPVVLPSVPSSGKVSADVFEIVAADVWGSVYCFDSEGKRRWKYEREDRYGSGYSFLTVGDIDGDERSEVLVATQRGALFALDREGRVRFEINVTGFRLSSPSVGDVNHDGRAEILFGNDDGEVYCVNGKGEVLWVSRIPDGHFGRTVPLVADANGDGKYELYISTPSVGKTTGLHALDAETGKLLWTVRSKLQTYASTVVVDLDGDGSNEILFGDKNTRLYVVRPDGRQLWDTQLDGNGIFYAPVIADLQGTGKAVLLQAVRGAGSNGRSLYAVDSAGKIVDTVSLDGSAANFSGQGGAGSPVLCRFHGERDLSLVIATAGGQLTRYRLVQKPGGGRVLWPGSRAGTDRESYSSGFLSSSRQTAVRRDPPMRRRAEAAESRPAVRGRNIVKIAAPGPNAMGAFRVTAPSGAVFARVIQPGAEPSVAFTADGPGVYNAELRWTDTTGRVVSEETFTYQLDAAGSEDARQVAQFVRQSTELRPRLGRHAALADYFIAMARAFPEQKREERGGWLQLLRYLANNPPKESLLVHQLANPWPDLQPRSFFAGELAAPNRLAVSMLGNEYESAAVVLTNLAPRDVTVRLQFGSFEDQTKKKAFAPSVVEIREIPLVRPTSNGKAVEDVLPLLGEGQTLRLMPGESRKVWLTFHSRELTAGLHRAALTVGDLLSLDVPLEVPVEVRVDTLRLPEQRTYRHENWLYLGSIPDDTVREATIADALAHGTNVFVIPPAAVTVSPEGRIVSTDSAAHDQLVKRLLGKAMFLISGTVGVQWRADSKVDPKIADAAYAAAIRWYVAHMKEMGVGPKDWAFYVRDEPGLMGHDATFDQWVKDVRRIKAADPAAQIYANPAGGALASMLEPVADLIDIWQPDLHLLREDPEHLGAIFRKARFWNYEAPGEQRELDPLGYYRMKPWVAWQLGMTGAGYWVYSSTPYWFFDRGMSAEYGTVYPTERGPVTTKRWEAHRDGVEDFELLWMLRERSRQHQDAAVRRTVDSLIDEAVAFVTAGQEYVGDISRKLRPYTPDYGKWMDYRRRLIDAGHGLGR